MTVLALHRPARRPQHTYLPARPQGSDGVGVRISALTKGFGNHPVLRGIDLELVPGEFAAVVGRSGCGKSTLLRLLAGLDTPDGGTLSLDGDAAVGFAGRTRIMFQDSRLLPWKRVIDNVGLGLRGDWRTVAEEALRQVGLERRASEWPAVLSGGQRQRVALARALVSHPGLLLLDEPLGALDALTRIEMQGLVEAVWRRQGFTAVLVTHDVAEAVTLADRVIVVEDGRIALDVPVDLPRPRERSHPTFAALEGNILSHLLRREGADA